MTEEAKQSAPTRYIRRMHRGVSMVQSYSAWCDLNKDIEWDVYIELGEHNEIIAEKNDRIKELEEAFIEAIGRHEAGAKIFAPIEKDDGASIYSMSAVGDIRQKAYIAGAMASQIDHTAIARLAVAQKRIAELEAALSALEKAEKYGWMR